MPPLRDKQTYMWDALDVVHAIQNATKQLTLATYLDNRMLRSAVEREFEIIGEALKLAAQYFPEIRDEITDFSKIVGFRNRLAHAYFATDHKLVWNIIKVFLPRLEQDLRQLVDVSNED
ncbi:MAG: HepT-like ribonuclease domain-containing protein [Deinococcota bacterium]